VQTGADLRAVREAAAVLGDVPFLIAKIERAGALEHLEEILESAEGLMIARGDLGVEIPIERIAVTQKAIMAQARASGKPVITATEMLESMTTHRRPTRAEATDVANAILDGTDCVMLSAESAVGRFPVASVAMLARIAAETEPFRPSPHPDNSLRLEGKGARTTPVDLIAFSVRETVDRVCPATVFVPSVSGATVRNIARFRLPVWITAVSPDARTCQHLQFSYGVCPVHEKEYPEDWNRYARDWVRAQGLPGNVAVLTEGPSRRNPDANHRMEIIDLIRTSPE
jgi:pyruvate kinase